MGYTSLAVPRPINWFVNPSVNFLTPILQNLGRSSVLGEAVESSRVSSSLTDVMMVTVITFNSAHQHKNSKTLFLLHVVAHDSSLDGNCRIVCQLKYVMRTETEADEIYVFVCRQSCFVHSYSERRRQLDSSVYVKDGMLSNCPQYSFRQADNEHRDSLKENIRNTFW